MVVLDEALEHGNESKSEHTHGEPDAWREFLEDHVRRNLEEDVRDEEDDQGNVVLVTVQLKLIGKAENISISDVDTAVVSS